MATEPRDAQIAKLKAEHQELTETVEKGKAHYMALLKIKAGEASSADLLEMPYIPEQERTTSVLQLMDEYQLLLEQSRELMDELARLNE